MQLQNVTVKEDFLPLELGSFNVILGTQWLRKLGEMQVKWQNLTMTFTVSRITLRDDPSLSRAYVSIKLMMKAIKA